MGHISCESLRVDHGVLGNMTDEIHAFQSNEGSLGLIHADLHRPQWRPVLLTTFGTLKITRLATSPNANHLLALSFTGTVHTIGAGEQNQLGRKLVERNKGNGLIVGSVSFAQDARKLSGNRHSRIAISAVAAGDETSYAIDTEGRVWSWGQDDFAQLGHALGETFEGKTRDVGNDVGPRLVRALSSTTAGPISKLVAGRDFAVALAETGKLWSWGRTDGLALGLPLSDPAVARDMRTVDSECGLQVLVRAHCIARVGGIAITDVAAGPAHVIALNTLGKVFVWGAGAGWRLGCGSCNDAELPHELQFDGLTMRPVVRAVCVGAEWAGMLMERAGLSS